MPSIRDTALGFFAESYARPGGNIIGVAFELADLTAKRLQLLKEVIPGVSRVAFLHYSGKIPEALRKVATDQLQAAETAARAMGLSVSMSAVARRGLRECVRERQAGPSPGRAPARIDVVHRQPARARGPSDEGPTPGRLRRTGVRTDRVPPCIRAELPRQYSTRGDLRG